MNENLDREEMEILEQYERGEFKSVPNMEQAIELAREAARNTLKKTKRVNLRVTERDFDLAHARRGRKGFRIRHCFPA